MTTEVVLLGTGTPRCEPGRAGPATLVCTDDVSLLFDAGRGVVLRLVEAGVRPTELAAVFLTHHHSDHLVDLHDVLFSAWLDGGAFGAGEADPLPVVAPAGPSVRFVERMLDPWTDDIDVRLGHTRRSDPPRVDVQAFEASADPVEVWSHGPVRVSSIAVHHEPVVPSVAFRVDTPDGAVVISGDTRVCPEIALLADGADVLVHEVVRARLLAPFAVGTHLEHILDYHADSVALGALAADAGVPVLMLTHLIPAPMDDAQVAAYESEVREGGYAGEVVVGRDLDRWTLGQGLVPS